MPVYTDDPSPDSNGNDQDPNVENYWLFTSDIDANLDNNLEELSGYSFQPYDHYNNNVSLRDGNDDTYISAATSANFHTNDGVVIDGDIYEVNRHWRVPVTITYKDGSDPVSVRMLVSRLRDDPDNAQPAGPFAGKVIFRIHDTEIAAASKDGTYGLNHIENFTFNPPATTPNFNDLRIENAFNDAFPFVQSIRKEPPPIRKDPPPVICFCAGTLLDGPAGQIAVENLNSGDLLQTVDHGCKPIRWIGTRELKKAELTENPNLRPIRIAAGALGDNAPRQALVVSPQHRVVIRSQWAHELFGSGEVLVPAKKLLSLPGIEVADDLESVTYYHVLLDDHEILLSNGAMTESLYLGEQTFKALTEEGRDEISRLFPELQNGQFAMAPIRMMLQRNRDVDQLLGNMPIAAKHPA